MADQAERVILEAEETPVLEAVGKANAALDSFEKKSESSHGKVIRISDQTRSSVQRLIASSKSRPTPTARAAWRSYLSTGAASPALQPRAAGHRRDHADLTRR